MISNSQLLTWVISGTLVSNRIAKCEKKKQKNRNIYHLQELISTSSAALSLLTSDQSSGNQLLHTSAPQGQDL